MTSIHANRKASDRNVENVKKQVPSKEASPQGQTPELSRVEKALSRTWKWLPLAGSLAVLAGCKGRPLWVEGEPRMAAPVSGEDWDVALAATVEGLSPELRHSLALEWLRDAGEEHASIGAFSRLSLELLAAGAPPRLLLGAQRAAQDEVRHARLCYSLAGAYAGEPIGPGAFAEATSMPSPLPASRRDLLLARLACESLRDGCLSEGFAAEIAEISAEKCQDPVVTRVLRSIARDEEEHAALAWSVLAWCLRQGGSRVCGAVVEAWRGLPDVLTDPVVAESGLEEYGRLGTADRQRLYGEVRRRLDRNLTQLLDTFQLAAVA